MRFIGQARPSGRRSEGDDTRTDERKRSVLVVDDDLRVRELITMLLQSEGFEAVELSDGLEALNYLVASEVYGSDIRRPDLVVADINMPTFTGLDLLAGMRESRFQPPVMLVTGVTDDEVHKEARRLGAVRVVKKPFDVDHFLDAIDDCLTSPGVESVINSRASIVVPEYDS